MRNNLYKIFELIALKKHRKVKLFEAFVTGARLKATYTSSRRQRFEVIAM